MLFRSNKGELIEIKKYDFSNDNLYYKKIMDIKTQKKISTKQNSFAKLKKTFDEKNNK
jgi:hypothetical protein